MVLLGLAAAAILLTTDPLFATEALDPFLRLVPQTITTGEPSPPALTADLPPRAVGPYQQLLANLSPVEQTRYAQIVGALPPATVSRSGQLLQSLSPSTISRLIAVASEFFHAYGAGMNLPSLAELKQHKAELRPLLAQHAAEVEELKAHKAELQGLKAQLCSTIVAC